MKARVTGEAIDYARIHHHKFPYDVQQFAEDKCSFSTHLDLAAQHEVDQLGEGVAESRHHLHHLPGRVLLVCLSRVVVAAHVRKSLADLFDDFALATQR